MLADDVGHLTGQHRGTGGRKMDVGGLLFRLFLCVAVQRIDRDSAHFGDHRGGRIVVPPGVSRNAALGARRDGRRFAPDHLGPGRFQTLSDLPQIGRVFLDRHLPPRTGTAGVHQILPLRSHELQIVETEIEMDDPPRAIPQPLVKRFQSTRGWTTIGGRPPGIGHVSQRSPRVEHVADRDGIAQQQHMRQIGVHGRRRVSRIDRTLGWGCRLVGLCPGAGTADCPPQNGRPHDRDGSNPLTHETGSPRMSDDSSRMLYRILDAAANRAGEGLRTLEEFARFGLDDADQSRAWKTLRHDLTAALAKLPRSTLLSARNTPADVGVAIADPREYRRPDLAAVIAAAATRTAQSLRTLEEYTKTIDPSLPVTLESLRYRCYSLAAELELRAPQHQRRQRLQRSYLYALVDGGQSNDALAKRIAGLAAAGVDLFQLRDGLADDRTLLERAKVARTAARQQGALLIVNDRADIAVAADADGVHVGQRELPAVEARRIVGPDRLVGVSTRSLEQARIAVGDGADYVGYGPLFVGRTKTFDQYLGTTGLADLAREIPIPVFAIGGIEEANVSEVIAAGVHRVAVTGALRDADEPEQAARRLKSLLTAALQLVLWLSGSVIATAADPTAIDHSAVLQSAELTESSGLAFSHRQPDRLWTHNDSGGQPELFAFDTQGRLTGRVTLAATTAQDWEALSSFTDDGTPRLLVGDCGDRPPRRQSIRLYLLDEPDPNRVTTVTEIQTLEVRYPTGPRDCEAVAVDARRRQIVLIEKRLATRARVFTVPLPERRAAGDGSANVTATEVAAVQALLVTGAEIDDATGDLWITNYTHARRFPAQPQSATLPQQLSAPSELFPLPQWHLIEAIAVDSQHRPWVTHEGEFAKLGRLSHRRPAQTSPDD